MVMFEGSDWPAYTIEPPWLRDSEQRQEVVAGKRVKHAPT